jgi:hypothetical protein
MIRPYRQVRLQPPAEFGLGLSRGDWTAIEPFQRELRAWPGNIQTSLTIVFIFAFLGQGLAGEPAAEVLRSERPIRQAVERSLPFLEKEGMAWRKKWNCIACHHVPYLLWAYNEAAARGFVIDHKKLREWNAWSLAFYPSESSWYKLGERELRILKRSLPAAVVGRLEPLLDRGFSTREAFAAAVAKALPAEEMLRYNEAVMLRGSHYRSDGGPFHDTQLLLGRRSASGAEDAAFAALATYLAKHQEEDGSWTTVLTNLTNQRRSAREMQEAITMWTVLALNSSKKTDAVLTAANERALSWLKEVRPGQTTESLVLLLLIRHKNGRRDQVKGLLDELLKRQNKDGGWSWLKDQASDALATGQSLYALGLTNTLPGNHPAPHRARGYLLKTQREDGSWLVPARQYSAKTDVNYLKGADAVYTYWGTGWATIGLLQSLP